MNQATFSLDSTNVVSKSLKQLTQNLPEVEAKMQSLGKKKPLSKASSSSNVVLEPTSTPPPQSQQQSKPSKQPKQQQSNDWQQINRNNSNNSLPTSRLIRIQQIATVVKYNSRQHRLLLLPM